MEPTKTNPDGMLIGLLIRSEAFRDYGEAFSETTGLPLTLRPVTTTQLPFRGRAKENAFCAIMAEKAGTCSACHRLHAKLARDAVTRPVTRACAYGLCETAVPVKLGDETIGLLQTGQVLRQKPTDASFRLVVEQARKTGVDISNARTKRAYFATPVVSQKRLDAAVHLLVVFAEHLAMKSNQLVVQAAHAEPLAISRAKHFIRDHYSEEISLTQVSSVVNTSLFHLCKLFRRCTAITFTEFVSRTRIENAKGLLLNRNLRISEVGFAVGFQSLTHFNRTFRKIELQSPTDYRAELSAAAGHLHSHERSHR